MGSAWLPLCSANIRYVNSLRACSDVLKVSRYNLGVLHNILCTFDPYIYIERMGIVTVHRLG